MFHVLRTKGTNPNVTDKPPELSTGASRGAASFLRSKSTRGVFLWGITMNAKVIERFLGKVSPEPNSGCWLWTAYCDPFGYGKFVVAGCEWGTLAHRAAYTLFVGPIPEGMCVCHTCDVPSCVNPTHLWIGTQADNTADMDMKGRRNPINGSRLWAAKLTEADVLAIRVDGRLHRLIAADYGVTETTISRTRLRKTWRHI